jgi:hypothetical protein
MACDHCKCFSYGGVVVVAVKNFKGDRIMPLPKECDNCKRKFIPRSSICRLCDDCLRKTKITNGKMRNETFKKMFELKKLDIRRL